jgi:hypothetical protein
VAPLMTERRKLAAPYMPPNPKAVSRYETGIPGWRLSVSCVGSVMVPLVSARLMVWFVVVSAEWTTVSPNTLMIS